VNFPTCWNILQPTSNAIGSATNGFKHSSPWEGTRELTKGRKTLQSERGCLTPNHSPASHTLTRSIELPTAIFTRIYDPGKKVQ
jgi:hypothetical protein